MVDESVLVKAAIEKAYRDRGGGFLAWAKRHAPDEETAEDDLKDAFIKAIANVSALSMVEDVAAWIFSAGVHVFHIFLIRITGWRNQS